MTFNVDTTKKIKVQQQEMPLSNTAEVKSTSINVPVGKVQNTDSDIYTKLGITKDEYLKLCNENPNFATLMFEEQLKYIQSIKNTVPPTVTTTNENPQTVEVTQVVATTEEEQADAPKKMSKESIIEYFGIDKEAYNKMSVEEKFNVYASELAKNKFIYNEENPQDIDAWNALSEEERNKLVENAKKESYFISKNLSKSSNAVANTFLDDIMSDLQAANFDNVSIDEYNSKSSDEKLETKYNYLRTLKEMTSEEQLTSGEIEFLQNEKIISDAVNYLIKKSDPTHQDVVFCPEDARRILAKQFNNLSVIEAKYEYLNNKKDLDEVEKEHFQFIGKLKNTARGRKYLERAKNPPVEAQNNRFHEDFKQSNYYEAYTTANSTSAKAFIIYNYISETTTNEKEFTRKLLQYNRSLNVDNLEEQVILNRYMLQNGSRQQKDIVADNENFRDVNALNSDAMNASTQEVYTNSLNEALNEARKNGNTEKQTAIRETYNDATNVIKTSGTANNATAFATGAFKSGDQNIGQSVIDNIKEEVTDPSVLTEMTRSEIEYASPEVVEYGAANNWKNKVGRTAAAKLYADSGNTNAINNITETTSLYNADEQKEVAQTVYEATQNMNDKDAKRIQKELANQIEHCATENQAEIHKMVSQSKYEEVVKQAAQNIYKYDESAQKEALKYTLETGNKEAIEVAISNVDKCKGLTNETSTIPSNNKNFDASLAKEIRSQQVAIEEKYTASVATQYADFMTEQDVRSGLVLADEKSKTMQKYIEEFKSPSSNKFALLGKLEPGLKKAAIKMLVKYAPTMINSFIDMGYGTQILNSIGETSDMAVKIVNIMDFKGQPEVRNVVQRHPEHYEELYVKYFMDNEKPEIAQTYTTTPTNFVSMFKQMNKDGKTIFKI